MEKNQSLYYIIMQIKHTFSRSFIFLCQSNQMFNKKICKDKENSVRVIHVEQKWLEKQHMLFVQYNLNI